MMLKNTKQYIFSKKRLPKIAIWLVLFLCFSAKIFAQHSLEFKHLNEKDGLSNNLVNCFLKDKYGFLWVGTFDGLNRFDGNNFAKFKKQRDNPNAIQSNIIYDLAEDKEGNIWFSTNIGIGCYHQNTQKFESFLATNKKNFGSIYNILCDKSGDIWFSAITGLYRYAKNTKTFEYFKNDSTQNASILKGTISKNGLIEDPHKRGLWMSSKTGLMYLDIDSKKFFHYKNNPQNLAIFKNESTSAIVLSHQNEIAFGKNYNEILIFDLNTLQIKKKIDVLKTFIAHKYDVLFKSDLSSIFFDSQNNIWISTFAFELFFIDNNTQQIHKFSHDEAEKGSIASSFFFTVFQDVDGTIMLGTLNGISYTNPEKAFYQIHRISKKLPQLEINEGFLAFCEGDDGWWWLGTEAAGLIKYNPISTETISFPFATRINSIIKVKNQLFVGSDKGFYSFDVLKRKFSEIKLPTEITKNSLEIIDVMQQNDTTIWLSSAGKYVVKYDLAKKILTPFDISKEIKVKGEDESMPKVFIDKNNDVWASTNWGVLLKFSENEQKFVPIKSLENHDFESNFYKPVVDKNNIFWIPSLRNGLVKYDPKINKFTLFSESDGLAWDLIRYAYIDNFGQIWAVAYNKFSVINPSKKSFQNFTLPINETNYDYETNIFSLKNGHLVSIMKSTLIEFSPEKFHNNFINTKPLINYLTFGSNKQDITSDNSEVRLGVEDNNFSVVFGFLPLPQNNRHQFSYKLEGFDENWTNPSENDRATYTNISGGDYVFKLRVSNGYSESKIAQIKVHIATVFYKRHWFLITCLIIIGSLIFAFLRFRANQRGRIHFLQLQSSKLEQDKTEIQYQNLINHLNPHFLFNSLTSLKSLIKTEPKVAANFLQKLSTIYRYILQNKDKDLVSLEQELSFVKHYFDLQKSRFQDGLKLTIDIDAAYLSREIVPVTLQNLLENAIKHNTIEEENPLIINVLVADNYLIVKNNLQKKAFVETSNKQGLDSLKKLYKYLSEKPLETIESEDEFIVKVPLL